MIYKAFCVFFAACLPFLFSLSGGFVFDDTEAIIKNPDVFGESWTNTFINDFWGVPINTNSSHKSYRPLTTLTFRVNYLLTSECFCAVYFKVTNLIFHITCTYLVWKVFACIINDIDGKKRRKWYNDGAYLATLLFAVHPIHTEAVSGIVGRADVLAGNTFFISFLLYRQAMMSSKWSYLYLLCALTMAAASMLFKENGITVLGFCMCYEVLKNFKVKDIPQKRNRRIQLYLEMQSVVRLIVTIVVILLCLYARWMIMGGEKPQFQAVDNPAAFSKKLFTKIATYNYIYFLNLLLFIWPQWLCYDWSMGSVPLIKNLFDYRFIFVVLMYVYGSLVCKAVFSKNNKESTKRLIIISVLLLVIPFLPASNIFFTVGFVIAERVLYISTAGYCLFISIAIQKLNRIEAGNRFKLTPVFFCLLLLILGLRTWLRADNWRHEYYLFVNGVTVCPENAKIHYNIAKVVGTIDAEWAIEEYKEAIRLHPTYYQPMNNLGNLLKDMRKYSEAEHIFKTALTIKNDFSSGWMNLGILLASLQRYKESEGAYMNALRYRKKYAECYYNLGNLYLEMNHTEMALYHWNQAIRHNSSFTLAWFNSITLLYETGQLERGQNLIPFAIKAVPNAPMIHFQAGNLYGKANNYALAERHFKIAIQLFGSDVKAIHYGNLGVLYHRWNKHPLAAEMYYKALKLDPNHKSARKYLDSLETLK